MKYTFSGHETFQCKNMWLKKGYDFVRSGKSFNDETAVVDLGAVKLTCKCCLGEDLGGFLEGSCGKEGIGVERRLGNTKKERRVGGKTEISLTCINARLDGFVFGAKLHDVDLAAREKVRIAAVIDLYAVGHLSCDNLDVLIVDFNVLTAVHTLYLADDVVINRINAVEAQDVLHMCSVIRS